MGNFVCSQCGLEYMGRVDIPPVELKCTICGNQNFSFELDEYHWDKVDLKKMRINKIIATLLIFFSIYTAVACFFQLSQYFNHVTDSSNIIAQTKFASILILLTHLLQALSFLGLFYYGFSVIINTKLDYTSKKWLYLGVFAVCLYILEYIGWSIPLRSIEGYTQTSSFLGRFFRSLLSTNSLYYNLFQLLAYASFFGLFTLFKREL